MLVVFLSVCSGTIALTSGKGRPFFQGRLEQRVAALESQVEAVLFCLERAL